MEATLGFPSYDLFESILHLDFLHLIHQTLMLNFGKVARSGNCLPGKL